MSQRTFPSAVSRRSIRWPIANDGSTPTPSIPASSRSSQRWSRASSAGVVQRWPASPTYWRSSSQIGQDVGGSSLSANWVAQVQQIQFTLKA